MLEKVVVSFVPEAGKHGRPFRLGKLNDPLFNACKLFIGWYGRGDNFFTRGAHNSPERPNKARAASAPFFARTKRASQEVQASFGRSRTTPRRSP